ncbi:cyanophycinase [Adhaeribacter sp. BT258]|uniref:Cyanophycinase n=1 Tax=Adhaeribacter terrigena TaxID=2793070 RepID=A0ABS1C611_9BACT|nr:cyanophycinase [Adhaeribacter terrigena]MBK0404817.1 cyanophycinase [Adhaeribacter terrigena]
MQTPKGKIVAIGGNEDKGSIPEPEENHLRQQVRFFENGILKRIHDELYGLGTRIEVVTTATLIPEEMGQAYFDAFVRLGCDNVGMLHIQTAEDVNKPEYLERLRQTNCVMFTGGNQNRIAKVFYQSKALELLKERYRNEEKFLISGTSAGAMALCKIMIEGSQGIPNLVKGNVQLGDGLGLLNEIAIDTHFINRRRFPRLIETIAINSSLIGVGLGEDTGILISDGERIETIGSGLVVVLDGRHMLENNYTKLQTGEPFCLENIVMHVLPRGRAFLMGSGKLV